MWCLGQLPIVTLQALFMIDRESIHTKNPDLSSFAIACILFQCVTISLAVITVVEQIPGEFKNAKSGADACEFWRKCGHRICPSLKPVAQAILGVPASAAHLSRDLSMAGQLVCREGCALDTAYAEMLLFLHGNFKYIPDDIPRLTAKQVQAAIPYRLTDPAKLREVAGLDTTQGEDMLDRSLYACADEYVEDQDVDGKGQDEMDEGGEAGEGRKGRGESAPRLETRRKEETGKKGKGKGNPST